jgi:hypothetical protein
MRAGEEALVGGDLQIMRSDRFSPSLERPTDLRAFRRTRVIER